MSAGYKEMLDMIDGFFKGELIFLFTPTDTSKCLKTFSIKLKQLGPLNSDWFEELTVRSSEGGNDQSVAVEHEVSGHKDEGVFRAPAQTPVLDSQMCSTPRIFRRGRPQSPVSGLEDSPNSGMRTLFPVPPGAESSPCLFGLTKDGQHIEKDWGSLKTTACLEDLLSTPSGLSSQATSAQRICESLGAEINPDLSWSSSFNTPSTLTPTVILSKTEGQSSPVSLFKDQEVIFVRKLFPSLSKGTESTFSNLSSVKHHDGNVQTEEQKSDSSSDNIGGVWKQTVPDVIEDGDVRSTVESVLNGAEDMLSFFFTNSSSALRRVKTQERKKRVNSTSKEVKPNPVTVAHTTDYTSASKTDTNTVKSPLFTSQLNNKDFTQWTPLSLSYVQTNQVCITETSSNLTSPHVVSSDKSDEHKSHNAQLGQSSSCTSEQQVLSPDSFCEKSQGRSLLPEASPALAFSRKPRKFVYRVQNLESKKMHNNTDAMAGKHYQESSLCQKEDADSSAGDVLVQPAETAVKLDHPASPNLDHDLDMTQLCKAFAEDFTQELNLLKSPRTQSSDCVLMPTCTEAEISKIQPKTEAVTQSEVHVQQPAEIVSLTDMQSLKSTACDSGYPTVHSGFRPERPSCSGTENLHSGFKTANNKIIKIPPEALMKAKAALEEPLEHTTHKSSLSVPEPTNTNTNHFKSYKPAIAGTSGENFPSENYRHGHEAGRETSESVLRSEATAENLPSTFMCQTNESGFKTASNKSITVSSLNLDKAKDIFMELDEEKLDSWLSNNEVQVCSVKDAKPSEVDFKNSTKPQNSTDMNLSLTASQRADVTELCSILEEAGSQCEFTQVKHTKIGLKCSDSLHIERDWDPEILAGIDFDDSFNSDLTERQVPKKQQSNAAVHDSVPSGLMNGDVGFQTINTRKSCHIKPDMVGDSQEKSYCYGFKTAKGNAVTISEKCLSKARNLFADIEVTEKNENHCKADTIKQKEIQSGDNQDKSCRVAIESELELNQKLNLYNENAHSVRKEAEMCKQICSKADLDSQQGTTDQKADLIQSKMGTFGFSTAGGKKVKISEKALQNAKKLLNEVAIDKESKYDHSPAKAKVSSWTSVNNFSTVLADSKMSDGFLPNGGKEHCFENCSDIKQAMYPTPQSVESNGFKMANGKGVSVSASAIQKSKSIFKDIDDGVGSSDETKSKEENAERHIEGATVQHAFVNGFKTASGKGVSFSEKAVMKAKTFFKSCDPDCPNISEVNGDDTSVMDDCGFEAVAGNMVHLSGMDSLNKETLKKVSTDLNKYVQRKFTKTSAEILQPPSGCGFSTASGATVSVSTEALKKAKAMLDDSNAASPGERRLEISDDTSISKNETVISGKTCGFSTASGREVTISEKTLHKAKSLFTDCDVDGLGPDPGNLSAAKTSEICLERIRLPFSPANNKNVAVSENEISSDKDVFGSCDDVSFDTCNIETIQARNDDRYSSEVSSTKDVSIPPTAGKTEKRYENMMNGGPKADRLGSGNFGFSTASGKGVCVSNVVLEVASEMFRDCDAQPVTNGQSKITNEGPCRNINKTPDVPETEATSPTHGNPSLLSFHSLNLNGCSVTQQKYLEQEAMACTKALLEDDLNENTSLNSLDMGIKESPILHQERCSGVNTGMRKRTPDDESLTGQPPLKRRLVTEFNQISVDRTVCALVKSNPNEILGDRRVFKYNLKPNITYPSRNVLDQTSSILNDQKRSQSDPKTPVFIPPFQKNLKTETQKNCVSAAVAQVPVVFVPPIKKKDASGSDYVKDSPHVSGDSPAITSSRCENDTSHAARKPEDQKAVTETKTEDLLENRTTISSETKAIWQQSLELAQDMQNMRIRKKNRQRVRPLPGTFYLAKTSGVSRVSLKEAVRHKCPELHTEEELYQHGVSFKVSRITSENAESFRFTCDEFFKHEALRETGGVQLADGGWLIPDKRGMLGKEEFYRALCDTPGVDPKLISEAWVFNHYRWVVWKRASMERAFPEVMGGRCLTPDQVLLQLKLRYDVEVDHSRRSALKKIMERDDTPAKTLVLCVCGIAKCDRSSARSEKVKDELPTTVIWLTDGWYSIKALLDIPLSTMLRKGLLRVGVKLLIHGAELIGSQDACSPLEAPDTLMLKISANSTRRARWDTKLGFHKDPRPFTLLLSSLYANGGVVSCVDIIVLRSYPTQWMEKKPGSVFVFRNERAEDREAARYNCTKQKTMEILLSRIQAQIEKEEDEKKKTRRSRSFSLHELKNLQEGEELHEAMESDPAFVEAHLSTQQVKAVSSYRRALTERKRAELQDRVHKAVQEAEEGCANRDVTPVWKLSIADSNDLHSSCVYTLNIWRPSLELRSLLREGCRYKAYHLATSGSKKRSGTSNIQFTATKKTQFQDIEVCPEWLSLHFPARQSVKFRDILSPGFSSPCGEVDIVGYVVSILDIEGTSPVLYFVDEKFDFVSVRICSSLALLALEDLVKPLALLSVSNLQLRQQSGQVPSLYAGEHALFSTNPKEPHLQEDISRLKIFVEDYEHFFIVAEEKLSNLIPIGFLNSCESPRTPGLTSLPKPNVKNNVTPNQTSRVFSPFTPVTKRTPVPTGNSDSKEPRSVKRKRGMEYLARLSNPLPIVPLGMVRSPRVSKTFNPPRRCETPRNPQKVSTPPPENKQWVNDEELAMMNTQTLVKR